jgi:hypothetical protein
LTRGIIELLHCTLLIKVGVKPSTLEISEEEWKELQILAELRSIEEMELLFQVFHQGLEWIGRSSQPKIILDILIIKSATAEALIYLSSPLPSSPATATPSPLAAPEIPQITPVKTELSSPPLGISSQKTWEGFIDHVRASRPLLASILEHSSTNQIPTSADDKTFLIFFSLQEAYFREQLQSRIYQEQLTFFSKEYLGHPVRLLIELKDSGESLAAKKERVKKELQASIKEKVHNHPIILEAKSLFGGELGPIEIKEADHAGVTT